MDKEQIVADIAKDGFIIVPMINLSGETPAVVHTVGLTKSFGVPELIVVGLPLNVSFAMLETAGVYFKEGVAKLADGSPLPLPAELAAMGAPSLILKDCLASEINAFPFVITDMTYADEEVKPTFQQLVVPDVNAKYPWDEGFAEPIRATQSMFWTEGGVKLAAPNAEVIEETSPAAMLGAMLGAMLNARMAEGDEPETAVPNEPPLH